MTVQELIEKLNDYDSESEVLMMQEDEDNLLVCVDVLENSDGDVVLI